LSGFILRLSTRRGGEERGIAAEGTAVDATSKVPDHLRVGPVVLDVNIVVMARPIMSTIGPPMAYTQAVGAVRSESFEAADKELGLKKHVTGRALRRTFQDLTREAEVDAVVAKAISGHATDAMRVHYSTASDDEVQSGTAKVIEIAEYLPGQSGSKRERPDGQF